MDNNEDAELTVEEMEKTYGYLVMAGKLRFEKRDCPRSHLEDELTSYMAWEIYGLLGYLSSITDLYRNSINGNYLMKVTIPAKGMNPTRIKSTLEERLSKVVFGDGYYYGIKAVPVSVKPADDLIGIDIECVMPPIVRYNNILNFLRTIYGSRL